MKILKYTNLALLTLIFATAAQAGENVWTTTGPPGGSVSTIALHPLDDDIIYVGTVQDGIYKSTNAGENWDHLPLGNLPVSVRVIQIHPAAPETMYVGTVSGMFKSTDAGMTWNLLNPAHQFMDYMAFLMHPVYPNILMGGMVGGYRSTDSGESWQRLDLPAFTHMARIAVDPVDPNNIYFVGGNMPIGNGVWKSTDLGGTWFSIQNNIDSTGVGTDIAVDRVDPNILYVARIQDPQEANACLYKSIDGGEIWFDITPPSLRQLYIKRVRVSPTDHQRVYVGTSIDGVLLSTDGGLTWRPKNSGLRNLQTASLEFYPDGSIILLGMYDDGIYKSTDGGDTWEPISQNINAAECPDAAVNPQDPSIICAACYNGLFRSSDAGESWQYMEMGQPPVSQVSSVKFDRYLSQDVYLSTFWSAGSPDYPPGFWRSTDDGNGWQFLNDGLPDSIGYVDLAISYLSLSDRRIFLASHGGVYYSDDVGDSWNACQGGLPYGPYWVLDVAPSDPNVLAAGDDYNRVFISTDRGLNWNQSGDLPGTGLYVNDIEFHPWDALHLYVTSLFSEVFESTDQGQSWTAITNDLPFDSTYKAFSGIIINPWNPSNIFIESNHMGVYQSHDGCLHWHSINAGLDTVGGFGHRLYFFPDDTTRLIMPTDSRSVWSIHRTITDVADDELAIPGNITLSAYPNPFNSRTVISIGGIAEANIGIYDITGRRTAALRTENGRAVWDAAGVSSGVYFARLEGGRESETIKMVLLR